MQKQRGAVGHILLLPCLVLELCFGFFFFEGRGVLESVGDIEKQKICRKWEYGLFLGIFDSFLKLAICRKTLFVFIHLVF